MIPPDLVTQWTPQMATDHADLTEEEKESDREQDRPIHLLVEAAPGPMTGLQRTTCIPLELENAAS
jgi:hypothetical protein